MLMPDSPYSKFLSPKFCDSIDCLHLLLTYAKIFNTYESLNDSAISNFVKIKEFHL